MAKVKSKTVMAKAKRINVESAIAAAVSAEVSSGQIVIAINNMAARVQTDTAEFEDALDEYKHIHTALEALNDKIKEKARGYFERKQAELTEDMLRCGLRVPLVSAATATRRKGSSSRSSTPSESVSSNADKIVAHIRKEKLETAGRAVLQAATKLTDGEWASAIKHAKETSLVIQEGERRGATYKLP